ncbi:MAG: sporulation protein [Bacteroidetes bacterium MedPE-SWsnd-G2]|nr:MAG: sporulation protein [Bacteroidetes bacterium MedPE-SWsnd-G2]
MQLETYISDLLYRYDCVTVPGFGAFLTQRVSAKVHDSTSSFYPPKKVLSFNEQLQNNDGLLISYLSEVEKIPFEVASKKVDKYVKSIKSFLVQGETISFNNIGELMLNADGNMIFEPSYHINYLTDSFGLTQFVSKDIKRITYKKEVEVIEETTPIAITPERRKSRTKPFLKYAAIAVIALTVGGLTASKYYLDDIDNHNQLAIENANEDLDRRVQEATFVIDNPLPAVTLSVEKQTGNYHVIAGAFRVEENSTKKVEELRELGYKARKIGVNKYGLHQVVYASYSNRLDALNSLRKIKQEHNSEAWLLVKALN